MNKTIRIIGMLYCFVLLFTLQGNAQQDSYNITQKTKTDKILKQYIRNILISNNEQSNAHKTIYVNFIPPMGCPRCEGILNQYNNTLNELTNGKAFIVNVLMYKKEKALHNYIQNEDFTGNILTIDETDVFYDIFDVKNAKISVPIVTKINVRKGRLVFSKPVLDVEFGESLVQQIIQKKTFLQMQDASKNSVQTKTTPFSVVLSDNSANIAALKLLYAVKLPEDSCVFAGADSLPVISKFSMNNRSDKILVNNFLNNSFFLFSKNGKNWSKTIEYSPTVKDDRMFIDPKIDEAFYRYAYKNKQIVSYYMNAAFDDTIVYIMASLPRLAILNHTVSNDTMCYNVPVCLFKTYQGMELENFQLNTIYDQVFTYDYYNGFFNLEDGLFVFFLKRGWPFDGNDSITSFNSNIFDTRFYDVTATSMYYDLRTGQDNYMLSLDNIFKRRLLGYYFSDPLIKKIGENYFYTERRLGQLYQINNIRTRDYLVICSLFDADNLMRLQEWNDNSMQYLESYKTVFNQKVIDFEVIDYNNIASVVRDENYYYVYSVKANQVPLKSYIPEIINGKKAVDFKFGVDEHQNHVIYGLYQDNQQIVTYTFRF